MTTSNRSFSDVLQELVSNFQEIVRSEVRLAKLEIRDEAVKAKAAGVLLGAGVLCGLFAAFFLLLASVYALTRLMPDWGAALTVAITMGIIAAFTVSAGMKGWKKIHPTPDKTIENVKENVEWVKQQIK